jgi:hypothetical protein
MIVIRGPEVLTFSPLRRAATLICAIRGLKGGQQRIIREARWILVKADKLRGASRTPRFSRQPGADGGMVLLHVEGAPPTLRLFGPYAPDKIRLKGADQDHCDPVP